VFASELGTPVDPQNIPRTIQIAAQRAGMPAFRSQHPQPRPDYTLLIVSRFRDELADGAGRDDALIHTR
jgi:hypothetical protein